MKRSIVCGVVLCSLVACGKASLVDSPAIDPHQNSYDEVIARAQQEQQERAKQNLAKEAMAKKKTGTYLSYRDGVVGVKPVILFFYASRDPFCEENHRRFTDLYRMGKYAISTYRVDYDAHLALKQRYRVITPDTIVLLDQKGEKLKSLIHPSEAELKGLVSQFSAL